MKLVTSLDQISREEQLSWLGHDYAIDVETEGLRYVSHKLIGVALYVNNQAYYFVITHTADDGESLVDYLTIDEVRLLIGPVIGQREVIAVLHHEKFDTHFFNRYRMPIVSRKFDTLLAAQLLDENRSNSLKALNSLVDIPHVKYSELEQFPQYPKGSPFRVPLEPFAEYAMKDAIITYKLMELFRVQLAKDQWKGRSLQDVFNEVWMPMSQVLQEMESRGFLVDLEETQRLRNVYGERIEELETIVEKAGMARLLDKYNAGEDLPKYYLKMLDEDDETYQDDEGNWWLDQKGLKTPVIQPTPRSNPRKLVFNLGSSKQMNDLVYSDVDLPAQAWKLIKTTPSGGESVDVENLTIMKYYLGDQTPEYIIALLEWRKAIKFVTTYLDKFLNEVEEDGAIHCFFNMAEKDDGAGGTATGRLSSSNPNLQQIPSRGEIGDQARSLFKARPGHKLVVADYSNMEMVVAAHYSKDAKLSAAFTEGLDVHAMTAAGQHNIDYDEFVKAYKEEAKLGASGPYDRMRRVGKTTNFGSMYGIGGYKFQRMILVQNSQEFTIDESYDLLKSFNETYAGLTAWKERVMNRVRDLGFVVTIGGRKRRLPKVFSPNPKERGRAERQAVNAIIQGACADILFEAMILIQATFKALGGGLIASVHDELIGEVPEENAEIAANLMGSLMVDLINPKLCVRLSADAHFGDSWLDAKKG